MTEQDLNESELEFLNSMRKLKIADHDIQVAFIQNVRQILGSSTQEKTFVCTVSRYLNIAN